MNHQGIEDTDLAERYVTGRLNGQERADFEEHFVDCPVCLERIEANEGFATGLKGVKRPAKSSASTPRRHWSRRPTWLLGGACAAGLLAIILLGARQRELSHELASEREALVEARREGGAAQQQLRLERTAREAAEARLLPRLQAPARIPVLALLATRGPEVPTLELSAASEPFLLLVERENPPRFGSYVVTLRSGEGVVASQSHLRPSTRDAVVVALDSAQFAPGTYSLVIEGESPNGRLTPVGWHSFRTITAAAVR
jgi:hypothetical protein